MAKGILLEAGTNEMELLVFRIGDTPFGINVAKVREIIQRVPTIHIPYAPPAVEGSFRLREQVLTLVNLGKYFSMSGKETTEEQGMIIIVEFNNARCGVLVDAVEVIHRLRWDQIEPPSQYLMDLDAPITGTAHVEKRTVLIADFETIVGEILGIHSAADIEVESKPTTRKEVKILLADDSSVLRNALVKILTQAGFEKLTVCSDGQQAWDTICEMNKSSEGAPDLVLSDIEMPQMDGLHLCSKIKTDQELGNIPVVLFSSLINEDNLKKGKSVGADAQVSKPDSQHMIDAIIQCLEDKDITLQDGVGDKTEQESAKEAEVQRA